MASSLNSISFGSKPRSHVSPRTNAQITTPVMMKDMGAWRILVNPLPSGNTMHEAKVTPMMNQRIRTLVTANMASGHTRYHT